MLNFLIFLIVFDPLTINVWLLLSYSTFNQLFVYFPLDHQCDLYNSLNFINLMS